MKTFLPERGDGFCFYCGAERYSIGPFQINHAAGTISMAPGTYHFTETVIVGTSDKAKIEGVSYEPPDRKSPKE